MKKYIFSALFLLVTCITFGNTTFKTEIAPWNRALMVVKTVAVKPVSETKKAFTDPYVTNCGAYIISPNYMPNYAVQIQVTFDQSVPVPYYAVISVTGIWTSQPGGVSEKYFTILFPTGWSYKSQNFHLNSTETVYPENTYAVDYGAQ